MNIFTIPNWEFIESNISIIIDTRSNRKLYRDVFNTVLIETFKEKEIRSISLKISLRELRTRLKERKITSKPEGNCYIKIDNITSNDLQYILDAEKFRNILEKEIRKSRFKSRIYLKLKKFLKTA